jgi:hypothetical protein
MWTFTADDVLRLVVAVGALVLLAYLASLFHRKITFEDALRAMLGVGAMLGVLYLSIVVRNDQASGALLLLLGQAGSWLFRGKLFQSDSPLDASPVTSGTSAESPTSQTSVMGVHPAPWTGPTTPATAGTASIPVVGQTH